MTYFPTGGAPGGGEEFQPDMYLTNTFTRQSLSWSAIQEISCLKSKNIIDNFQKR